ncbi:SRPBCC family protein [Pseudarthrobacter sulfonivorans]|uniref:SRPBCC family protein n=1 Tax=Pseudarthrobacter sulfonivorans TaxID=121292 RepID=UPI002858BA3C|nr:SRPBCC family protein [Pseudarthrobacter sulfonivorans]MDR6414955.1 ligand-binding SRPBCC domain-containing protein [Pseudarthrobacter sulfonivorans]
MAVIEESVFISRPRQEVFDFLITTSNIPVWDSSVIQAEQLGDGPVEVGTRFKGTSKIMGRRFDWVTENTEFDPPAKTVIRTAEGPFVFAISYSLEPQGDGTQLTYRIDADSGLGGVFGKLADTFVQKAHARTVRANLETLADLLAEHPDHGVSGT